MALRTLEQYSAWAGKIVLLRIDANVPIEKGEVLDDSRLRAVIPTIDWLRERKARIVVVSHLGRPDGKQVRSLSLKPVAKRLGELTQYTVSFTTSRVGGLKLQNEVAQLRNGQVLILENIRFYAGEETNDQEFVQQLAHIADVYVNDGFAVAHRESASVVGVAKVLPAYAGLLMQKELAAVDRVHSPKKPAVLIVGGIKIETKLPVIRKLLPQFDAVLVSGGVFNTMLAAKGYGVGSSVYDGAFEKEARWLWSQKKVYTPIDLTVGTLTGKRLQHVPIPHKKTELASGELQLLDVGPATMTMYQEIIESANTIVWNGPLGFAEHPAYQLGVNAVAEAVGERAKNGAFALVGGGETVEALNRHHMVQYITHISTGGGALLHALSGKPLPGVRVLQS